MDFRIVDAEAYLLMCDSLVSRVNTLVLRGQSVLVANSWASIVIEY